MPGGSEAIPLAPLLQGPHTGGNRHANAVAGVRVPSRTVSTIPEAAYGPMVTRSPPYGDSSPGTY